MKRMIRLCLLLGIAAGIARAQALQNVAASLQYSLVGKKVVLRSFSGDDVVHAKWVDGKLTLEKPHWHIFAIIQISSVTVRNDHVVIQGVRSTIFRTKSGKLAEYAIGEPADLDIDIPADAEISASIIQENLFFASLDEAAAAVPKKLQKDIPPQPDNETTKQHLPKCDCALEGTDACMGHEATDGFVPPKLLTAAEPQMTNAAIRAHSGGNTQIELSLDSSGKIADIWIVKPAAYGLDTQGALAARQYTFKPATCHNNPVPTSFPVNVNFEFR
jgi:hypothetical protein